MKQTSLWRGMVLRLRRRVVRMAAYYRSARTTFEVLRVLDEESLRAPVPALSGVHRRRFVARTGFVV